MERLYNTLDFPRNACVYHVISLYGLFGSHHDAKKEVFALVHPNPSMSQCVAASECQPPCERGTWRGSLTISEDKSFDTTPMVD